MKNLLTVPNTANPALPLAIPILILGEEIIYENGVAAYRAIRVLEGELVGPTITVGPVWDGVPGSLFWGTMRLLVREAYLDSWKPFEGQEVLSYDAYLHRN